MLDNVREWLTGLNALEVLGFWVGAAIVAQWILTRIVLRLTRRTTMRVDEDIVLAIRWPILATMVFLGIHVAIGKLDLAEPEPWVVRRSGPILTTVAAFLWMRALMRVSDILLDAMARHADRFDWIQTRSLPLFEILTRLVAIGVAVYVMLNAWGKDLTGWLASAGILGIAIGFAAKDTLANLFAGIFILADAPYKLGDFIVLGSGERGLVTDIGIRSTRILTRDDIEITIPNSIIANGTVVNETGGPHEKRRIRVTVGVAYGSDVDRVTEVLEDVGKNSPVAAKSPAPRVRFREFGDSALTFQLMVWIDRPVLRGRAVHSLNCDVYKRLNAEGIEIPFPQRVVHLSKPES